MEETRNKMTDGYGKLKEEALDLNKKCWSGPTERSSSIFVYSTLLTNHNSYKKLNVQKTENKDLKY